MVACRHGISLHVFKFISHSLDIKVNTRTKYSISTRAHVLSSVTIRVQSQIIQSSAKMGYKQMNKLQTLESSEITNTVKSKKTEYVMWLCHLGD